MFSRTTESGEQRTANRIVIVRLMPLTPQALNWSLQWHQAQSELIMNNGRNDCRRVSRRVVLTGTALGLRAAVAAIAVSQAAAQQKISQADAKYQGTQKDDQHCDGCVNFQPPNACKSTSARAAGACCLPGRPCLRRLGRFPRGAGRAAHCRCAIAERAPNRAPCHGSQKLTASNNT
jgi:hypothetical protein